MPPCADLVPSILSPRPRRVGSSPGSRIQVARKPLAPDWVSIVGEPIASNTWPDQIRYKKLYLLVHNSVWLHQLTFLKPTLIHKLNTVAGGELVTDIVLRVGEIPSRVVVPARSPAHLDGDLHRLRGRTG